VSANGTDLPKNWLRAKLGDITQPTRPRHSPGDYPELRFVGMEHIEAHTMRLLGTVPAESMRSSAVHFQPGDVLYGRLRPYLNKVFRPDFEGLCSAEFIVFPETDSLDQKYLQYLLNSAEFVAFAAHLNAGDRPRVDFDQIADFDFPLAPLAEQKRIVAEIEKQFTRLDATVAALKRLQANLKRYRAAVLKAACEGHLTADWRKRPHVEKSHGSLLEQVLSERKANWERGPFRPPISMQNSELVNLPASWTWQPFDAFVTDSFYGPRFGESEYAEEGVPTIRTTDIAFGGRITLKDPPRIDLKKEDLKKFGLRDGDLLVTRTGATIGKCALYKESIGPAIPSAYLIRFRLTRMSVPPSYLLLFLMSPRGQEMLLRRSTAVAQPNVNATTIAQFAVPLPPREEIDEIVRRVDELFESAEATEKNVTAAQSKVEKLRQSILARAFDGKLVPQEANDEPAQVLLERIRADRNASHKSIPPAPRGRRKKEAAHVS